jgi:murein DD-endopeptidase MepM/ murein hydrolase activator NlpD
VIRILRKLFLAVGLLYLTFNPSLNSGEGLLIAQDPSGGMTIHVVQRGENLFRIAMQYGLTTEQLAAINGITDLGNIQVGQRLLVPGGTVPVAAPPQTHVVQAGETLRSIAEFYGQNVDELAALNSIGDVNAIYVGQVLTISSPTLVTDVVATPVATPNPPTAPPEAAPVPEVAAPVSLVYVVQGGETLFRIATRYGLTVNDLASANGIADPTVIYVGQQLIIPGVEPPQLAFDLPAPATGLEVMPLILVEGQAARFRLTTRASATVSGTFLGRVLPVISEQDQTSHIVLVGVPVGLQGGIYPLSWIVVPDGGEQIDFTVNVQIVSGNYSYQNLTLPQEKVNLLDPAIEQAELLILQNATNIFTSQRYFDGPMGLPAAAVMNSPFGTHRTYNGDTADHIHYGTDFAAAPGTPILAAAAGRVVLADALNIRGNVTMIDHGWGVFTTYSHQTERYVQPGDMVAAGQVMGTTGATGRATGAHLHWEVWVNGVPVDPMPWLRQSFS